MIANDITFKPIRRYNINLKDYCNVIETRFTTDINNLPWQDESFIKQKICNSLLESLIESNIVQIETIKNHDGTTEFIARMHFLDESKIYAHIFPQDAI